MKILSRLNSLSKLLNESIEEGGSAGGSGD